ncbi:MAG: DNA methyltransferase [Bacteroidaceae bacterium]
MNPISEVYNMDCMEYMKNIPDKFFDLAVVDAPYGINAPNMNMGSFKGIESTAEKLRKGRLNKGAGKLKDIALQTMPIAWDNGIPSKEYFDELFRVSKNQIIWGGNYFPLPPSRCIVCWDKMQPWDNFSQIELAWTSFDYPAKLFKYSTTGFRKGQKIIHPTQKPIPLYAYIFRQFANDGDKILDTHLGSGSSRIAAYKMGFDFYATEIDKEYFNAHEERFKLECFGEIKTSKGIITQTSLFE